MTLEWYKEVGVHNTENMEDQPEKIYAQLTHLDTRMPTDHKKKPEDIWWFRLEDCDNKEIPHPFD